MITYLINHLVNPLLITICLILIAGLVHDLSPPKKYDSKYICKSIILSSANTFLILVMESLIYHNIINPFPHFLKISQSNIYWLLISSLLYFFITEFLFWVVHIIL